MPLESYRHQIIRKAIERARGPFRDTDSGFPAQDASDCEVSEFYERNKGTFAQIVVEVWREKYPVSVSDDDISDEDKKLFMEASEFGWPGTRGH